MTGLIILPVFVGEAHFSILIFFPFVHPVGVHQDKVHSNAENNITNTFYEKLMSAGSVLKVSSFFVMSRLVVKVS